MGYKSAFIGVVIAFVLFGILASVYLSFFGTCVSPQGERITCYPSELDAIGTNFVKAFALLSSANVYAVYTLIVLIIAFVTIGYTKF